jgi:hypothetical protein
MIVVACLLLVPLLAMQFDTGVNWTFFDFLVAGVLLVGTGLAYEFLASRTVNLTYRTAVAIAVGAALLLIWVNLAVGFIGDESNPANLMYLGVLAVEVGGAVITRFRAEGMAWTLFATAAAQVVVGAMALTFRLGGASTRPIEIIGTSALWALAFASAGALFLRAADGQASAYDAGRAVT